MRQLSSCRRENEASDTARRLAEAERERKKALLRAISAKLTGPGVSEMAPLEYDYSSDTKAVLLVMNPIQLGTVQLSRSIHSMLGKHVGMSLDSVSHWALIVVDRSLCETNYCYELMSDEKTLIMLGKNVARSNELTAAMTESWKCCYYVGETTRSHSDIQNLGMKPALKTISHLAMLTPVLAHSNRVHPRQPPLQRLHQQLPEHGREAGKGHLQQQGHQPAEAERGAGRRLAAHRALPHGGQGGRQRLRRRYESQRLVGRAGPEHHQGPVEGRHVHGQA